MDPRDRGSSGRSNSGGEELTRGSAQSGAKGMTNQKGENNCKCGRGRGFVCVCVYGVVGVICVCIYMCIIIIGAMCVCVVGAVYVCGVVGAVWGFGGVEMLF